MIKDLMTSSPYLEIHKSGPFVYVAANGSAAGELQYNTRTQEIEVFDGCVWQPITNYFNIGISPRAKAILEWAERKMYEDMMLQELSAEHPAIKAALDRVSYATEQLKIIIELSKKNDSV